MSQKITFYLNLKKVQIAGSILLVVIFILPMLSIAGSSEKIYVDDDASGTQDGSKNHPYKTIKKALKKADGDSEVHIRKGTYEENIEIPKGVEVYGSDRKEVFIKADNDDEPTVRMNHKTKINNVTIKDGRHGIKVGSNDKATITECIIRKNDKDGINIREGDTTEKRKVSILRTEINNNGRSGIYSKKRKLVIINNEIIANDSDGIDIEAGSEAWIDDNKIKHNDGSGLKITLDSSEIWIKSGNTFRDNNHEGIEVDAYGKNGRIDIKKSKFIKNEHYGIARIQRGNFVSSAWQGLTIQTGNTFTQNTIGTISSILKIF